MMSYAEEPLLFTEHLWKWRRSHRDTYYDAGVTLFRAADFDGTGVVPTADLRVSLKSSRWCVMSEQELSDLFDHVGTSSKLSQEGFCDAFCIFVRHCCRCGSDTSDRSRHRCSSKQVRYIGAAPGLNARSGTDVFRAKLVRMKSIKAYLSIFKGMDVSKNGTVTIEEFENHMSSVAPELLPCARTMFSAACRQGSRGMTGCGRDLDFKSLLAVLFPSATKTDINELVQMTVQNKVKRSKQMALLVADARDIFQLWSKGGDGLLSFAEMEAGLEAMHMAEGDIDEWLEQVFGTDGEPHFHNHVSVSEFTEWFASHGTPLTSTYANY
eukprot:jgi/Tetstr1/448466/TSEL_035734.t1